jgi:8-oxo-dGTP pyrophosphatase MutT (NUDIX family)
MKVGAARQQIAALPYRIGDEGVIEVLLVTSRETGRWIIPKGWPMKNKKPHKAAAQEAAEEAGVKGTVASTPIGQYRYWKRRTRDFVLCEVNVYPLHVLKHLKTWPERGQRALRWFTPEEAALHIDEPELAALVRDLPQRL